MSRNCDAQCEKCDKWFEVGPMTTFCEDCRADEPSAVCPLCWHAHLCYDDEDCVSCGCTAARAEDGHLSCAHCTHSLADGLEKHRAAACMVDCLPESPRE